MYNITLEELSYFADAMQQDLSEIDCGIYTLSLKCVQDVDVLGGKCIFGCKMIKSIPKLIFNYHICITNIIITTV